MNIALLFLEIRSKVGSGTDIKIFSSFLHCFSRNTVFLSYLVEGTISRFSELKSRFPIVHI